MPHLRTLRRAAAAALLPLLGSPAFAQPVVHAGRNQEITLPQGMTQLHGVAQDLTPLAFWIADGDGASENCLIKYDGHRGTKFVGPLQTAAGTIYGWPSDLERVGSTIYGIETFQKRLYTLDDQTGICTNVGSATSYSTLFGLAYDRIHDKLYAVDQSTRKLLTLDRTTGKATLVLTLPKAHTDVRGIAYDEGDGKIYYCDDKTEALYRVDPANGTNEHLMDFHDGPNAKIDEVDFFHGRLFGSYRTFNTNSGVWSMQLVRLDYVNGDVEFYGPKIKECSAHSLMVKSIPEQLQWVQVKGPTPAHIVLPNERITDVTFSQAGVYEFELRAMLFETVVASDRMIVKVDPPGAAGGSGNGAGAHPAQ